MQPIFHTSGIRAIEAARGTVNLMEKAGLAIGTLAESLLPEESGSILIVAGPGNNGGDALVAARHLKESWQQLDVVFAGDAGKLPPDAARARAAWSAAGGTLLTDIPEKHYDLVIDGLFGIGLSRPLQGIFLNLVRKINALDATVLAIDIPSGLNADTGRALGETVVADHTLTFLGLKPGLFTSDGVDHAGIVHVSNLGISSAQAPDGWLINETPVLPAPRKRNSHKGTYGSVGILGGDHGMVGAPLLAARAALLTGSGRVYAGLLTEYAPVVDFGQPELMLRKAREVLDMDHLNVLIVGPGLGRSANAVTMVQRALRYPVASLIVDADALVLIAEHDELRQLLVERAHPALLTPHPGEAAALLGCSIADIQSDRIAKARDIAEKYHAITLLKGAGTVIAMPFEFPHSSLSHQVKEGEHPWYINTSGNPGLAAAGMGDALSGIMGALVAQGMALDQAALLGAWLHGAAADALVEQGMGPLGLTASEVALKARELINLWITPSSD
ncbi:MAG: NAD(P)H-hydrate dehydratase [Methylobacillus sp.]|jgi:hydroxyethylthiazole kinase-like uncharacterized protein yjeF|nr:NAD(P)H-hydrate dehydratase [Methylobacillus sp.]